MYCTYHEDEKDREDCNCCERKSHCNQLKEIISEEKGSWVVGSELFKTVKEKISSMVGIPDEESTRMVTNLCADVVKVFDTELKSAFAILAKKIAQQYVEIKCKKFLDDCFSNAISEEIMSINGNDEFSKTTVKEVVMKKTVKFLKDKSNYSERNRTEETISKAIEKVVSEKVEEALRELKLEAIDKFNKEAMKEMMRGMAKALGQDKKLLTLLTME